jgi:hypothetical protein
MSDSQDEARIFNRLRAINDSWKCSYAAVGLLCKEVEDRRLWESRCASFTDWMALASPYATSQAYQALKDVRAVSDVPAEDLAEIPQANFSTLKRLSTHVRLQPEVLQAAKTMDSPHFAAKIQQDHPDQLIEARRWMRFHPEVSAAERIEQVLLRAFRRGAQSREEALEMALIEAEKSWDAEDAVKAVEDELEMDRYSI